MNIVFIPNINLGNSRNTPYHYSIKSWQKWSKQYDDVKVIEWDEAIMDFNKFKITLQRYWVHDILKHNKIEYEQVLVVDADTIIHPNCPNFFELTDGKFSTSFCNGDFEWVNRSIKGYSQKFFDTDYLMMASDFFQTGFVILNKDHEEFLNYVIDFYWKNQNFCNYLLQRIKLLKFQPLQKNQLSHSLRFFDQFVDYKLS